MSKNELNGILIIDKEEGPTSHDIVAQIRRLIKGISNSKIKVGHTGTLDPFATGVLLIAIGTATRLIEYSHDLPKTYLATINLGSVSDTDDKTGQITPMDKNLKPAPEEVNKAVSSFVGTINQMPPAYAAIKVAGKKLYEYARENKAVKVQPRKITIHNINIINYNYPEIELEITCSTGTYIRSLARDIGEKLKTGAYVSKLKRTAIGKFDISNSIKLNNLSPENLKNSLLTPDNLIENIPQITINNANVAQLKNGLSVQGSEIKTLDTVKNNKESIVSIYNQDGLLIGIGRLDQENLLLSPNKIL